MTQGGGGGFETGADFVAAKVSVDIDTQSIQSLKQLSEGINNFRTTTEAAARGSSSFTGMLQQMTQAANMSAEAIRQLGAMQERTADFSQRMQTGGAGGAAQLPLSRNAPQGFVDNFAGMGVGMGMGGSRTSSSDVAQQLQQQAIDPTRQNDPRKYLSAQAGRSRLLPGELTTVSPGETDWGSHADRVEARDRHQRDQEDATSGRSRHAGPMDWQGQAGKYQGLANNMMNEMAPGRGFGGMANMAASGLGALASRFGGGAAAAGEEGGAAAAAAGPNGVSAMLGGLLKFLPGLGGIIGAAVGGLALVEKGGSIIQGMKNVGMVQGGGAGQGLGDEMRIRAMALDPFLTTEQARQVVMAGLTEGYKGNTFDVVTKFLASNLKDMNLSVGDSVQLLRKNVAEGGESIGDLSKQLHGLKDLAKTGTTSLPDLQKNFAATSGALTGAGVSGKVAGDIAAGAAGWFNTEATRGLKGQGSSIVQSLISGPEGGVGLEAFGGVKAPGVLPDEIVQFLSAQPGGKQKVLDAAKRELINIVRMFVHGHPEKNSPQYLTGVRLVMGALAKFMPGTQLDQAQVESLVDNVLAGNDPTSGAKDDTAAAPGGGGGPAPGAGGGAAPGAGGGAAAGGGGGPVGRGGGTFTTPAGTSSAPPWGAGLTSAMVGQYGGGVQIIDAKGNSTPYTGSKAQQTGLSDGALKWARAGGQGGGLSLGQTTAGWGGSNKSGAETKVSFAPAIITVHVNTQTGKATVSPNVVQLTPNAQAVNAGVGSGTLNNPPPGDGYGGYTYAGGTGTGVRE